MRQTTTKGNEMAKEKGCGFCEHTGVAHESDLDGRWFTVPCPMCRPRTRDEQEAKAQEMRDLLAGLQAGAYPQFTSPAWR